MEMLKKLIQLANLRQPAPRLNLLIPRNEVEISHSSLQELPKGDLRSLVNMIPTPSDDTLWAQDYMEIGFDLEKKESFFLDLPYTEREGEGLPPALSLICKSPLEQQPLGRGEDFGNGDYGGNIESYPGHLILIGDNMAPATKIKLANLFKHQELVSINVNWLETGHVDELFSYLPNPINKNCPFMLNYASPKLAIELLNNTQSWEQFLTSYYYEKNLFLSDEYNRTDFSDCFSHSTINESEPLCRGLLDANMKYEDLIQKSLSHLQEKLNSKLGCSVPSNPLPLLFAPANPMSDYGTDQDYARSINPNPINNILIGENLVVARQANQAFQSITDEVIKATSIQPHYVNGNLMHYLSGGIHCTVNIIRACK